MWYDEREDRRVEMTHSNLCPALFRKNDVYCISDSPRTRAKSSGFFVNTVCVRECGVSSNKGSITVPPVVRAPAAHSPICHADCSTLGFFWAYCTTARHPSFVVISDTVLVTGA